MSHNPEKTSWKGVSYKKGRKRVRVLREEQAGKDPQRPTPVGPRRPGPTSDVKKRAAHAAQQAGREERRANLRARLIASTAKHGPDSIYAEMLVELDAKR